MPVNKKKRIHSPFIVCILYVKWSGVCVCGGGGVRPSTADGLVSWIARMPQQLPG